MRLSLLAVGMTVAMWASLIAGAAAMAKSETTLKGYMPVKELNILVNRPMAKTHQVQHRPKGAKPPTGITLPPPREIRRPDGTIMNLEVYYGPKKIPGIHPDHCKEFPVQCCKLYSLCVPPIKKPSEPEFLINNPEKSFWAIAKAGVKDLGTKGGPTKEMPPKLTLVEDKPEKPSKETKERPSGTLTVPIGGGCKVKVSC